MLLLMSAGKETRQLCNILIRQTLRERVHRSRIIFSPPGSELSELARQIDLSLPIQKGRCNIPHRCSWRFCTVTAKAGVGKGVAPGRTGLGQQWSGDGQTHVFRSQFLTQCLHSQVVC